MTIYRSCFVALSLFATTSCFKSTGSDTAQFAGAGGTVTASVDNVVAVVNDQAAMVAALQNKAKVSDYYSELMKQAKVIGTVTIGSLQFRDLGRFFEKNRDLITDIDKQYANVGSFRASISGNSNKKVSAHDILMALKALNTAMTQPMALRSRSASLNLVMNERYSDGNYVDFSDALALADNAKDFNGGCTEAEADTYRQTIAKPLCESSQGGKQYLEQVGKLVGYGSTATGAIAGAAAVVTPAAVEGASAGVAASIGAAAGSVGTGFGLLGGAIALVYYRSSRDAKHFCPQAVKAAPIFHCECSDDDACHDGIIGS